MIKFKDLKTGSIFQMSNESEPIIKFKNYSASNLGYVLHVDPETNVILIVGA